MWFLWQLLHQANVLLTTNEGRNQWSAFVEGDNTPTPNSVEQPLGFFLSKGKVSGIKKLDAVQVCH